MRFLSLAIALFSVALLPVFLSAQIVSDENGVLVNIHRFQPPAQAQAAKPPAASTAAKAGELSESAIQQINALEDDKHARTATQLKIGSKLIYTARMLQGQSAAPGVSALHTNLELDEQNRLFVDIKASVTDDLLQRMRALGVRIVSTNPAYRNVRAFISPYQLESVAALPEVRFIGPRSEARTVEGTGKDALSRTHWPVKPGFAQRAANVRAKLSAALARPNGGTSCAGQGSVVTEGLATHRAGDACVTFGVTGAGVKVGVLSDGVNSLALSQDSGDLGTVTVLPGQAGDGDEGTAMLEIVHDMAPNAQLFFATAFDGIDSFAQNILALRDAGCDIIVDDVIYFVETPFQDGQAESVLSEFDGGVVVEAVNEVVADGAMYFSSAGNEGNQDINFADTYEGDFVNGGTNSHTGSKSGTVHKFGTNSYDVYTFFSGAPVVLHWSDPLGGSDNDYDLFILDPTGSVVEDSSTEVQSGSQDPVEGAFPAEQNDRIVVFKDNSAANRFLHVVAFGALMSVTTPGAVVGHAGASGAFAIGATPAFEPICDTPSICPTGPFPDPFNSTNFTEPYSSDGPRHIFFEADGTAITPGNFSSTGGTVLQKPDFTAADGVSVTGVGGFGSPFYGTSAAAPHAASVAALVKSSDSTLTNADITAILTSSAIDIMGAGTDRDSGAGIVMAYEAVLTSLAPQITNISPVSGDVGTSVTITGRKFGDTQGESTVTFNGTPGTPTAWSDTSITVPVPAGATNGNVVVTVNGISSNGVVFTFTPNISGLSVNAAPVGTAVTIAGTNFGATQGTSTVTFNGQTATITSWSATSIVANVPANGTGNVVVTINGIASNGIAFTVQDFSFTAAPADISVTAGQSKSENFTIDSATGFSAAITLTCTGMPDKSTCTLTPNSIASGGTPADVQLSVTTTAATTSGVKSGLFGLWLPLGGLGLVLAGVGTRKRTRKGLAALSLFLLLPLLAAIVSCGGSSHHTIPGTPPGTYTISVKATSGATSHTSTFKLTVN